MKNGTRQQISIILFMLIITASLVIVLTEGNIVLFYGTDWKADTMAFRIAAVIGAAIPYTVLMILLYKLSTKGQFVVSIIIILFAVGRISEAFRYIGRDDKDSIVLAIQFFNMAIAASMGVLAFKGAKEAKLVMDSGSSNNNIQKDSE